MKHPTKVKKFKEPPLGPQDSYVSKNHVLFSILNQDGEMIGPLVHCKSYMTSRLWGLTNGGDSLNHSYSYDKIWPKSDLLYTRLLVAKRGVSSGEFEKEVKLAIDLVNQVEKELGLLPSKYYEIKGVPTEYSPALLVVGSKRWMLAPPMFNLYLLLLRSGQIHTPGQDYMKAATACGAGKLVKFLVENKYWKVFGKEVEKNWPKDQSSSIIGEMGVRVFSKEADTAGYVTKDRIDKMTQYFKTNFSHWKLI